MAGLHPWELAWKEGRWYEVSPPFPAVIEFAVQLKEAGAKNVLDFGCGAGRHSVYLAKKGFRVVGFDVSSTALRTVSQRLKSESLEGVLIVESEMSGLPFVDECFDAVVSTNVLHHARTVGIRRAVDEIHRVMGEGASGLIVTLSENDYKNGSGRLLEARTYVLTEGDEQGIMHHFFSKEELLSCFGAFEILSIKEELIPMEKGNRGHFYLNFKKRLSIQGYPASSSPVAASLT